MSDLPDHDQEEARRWLAGASQALTSARHQLTGEGLPGGIACFLAHLAAEKALKAVLIALHHPFRRSHDLPELLELIIATGFSLQVAEEDVDRLNPWAIDGRYLEDVSEAAAGLADDLVSVAARVVAEADKAVDGVGSRSPDPDQLPLDRDEEQL